MRQSVTKELYGYWNRLRGARAAPDRCEIDPAQIRHALADAFILEIDQNSFPIRLCGTRLNALWLAEQKGSSFLELWDKADRRDVAAVLRTAIDGVAPVVAGVRAAAAGERETLDLELLLLPLRHFGKTHARLLGSLAQAHRPAWFGLAPAEPLRLRSVRVINEIEKKILALPPSGAPCPTRLAAHRPRLVVHQGAKA